MKPEPAPDPSTALAWFCVHTQPKHEHIAAARLRSAGLEVFLPRIRFKKPSVRGPVWVTEALFPNYLFARFDPYLSLRLVRSAAGVATVVGFGGQRPTVPDGVVEELRAALGRKELHVINEALEPGDAVQISGGALHGLMAVVTQVRPGKERVRVLLEFLGQQTSVELGMKTVLRAESPRGRLL